MRTMLIVAIVGLAQLALAAERDPLGGGATPRATDLLRAETLAEQAARRLRLPARRPPGWARGGTGWTTGQAHTEERTAPVVINVRPPKRRSSRDDGPRG